ncbi:class F sortase [Mycolicibacterium moriokaense]|nr:class F sortase [Mycolicibacterium moriokaense]
MRCGRRRRLWLMCWSMAALLSVAGCGVAVAEPAAPATGAPGPPVPPLPLPALSGVLLPQADPVWLDIPALGIHTDSVVPLDREADGTAQVPADAHTVGWYTGGPSPGALGPAVLIAHVDWKGQPGLFRDLYSLPPGSRVRVGRADGLTAVFQVDRVEQFDKDRFPSDLVYGSVDRPVLRMITCGGAFDSGRRSYRDNVVAFADLVRVDPGA